MVVESIPTREYGWVVAFIVWLSGLSIVAALGGFAVAASRCSAGNEGRSFATSVS